MSLQNCIASCFPGAPASVCERIPVCFCTYLHAHICFVVIRHFNVIALLYRHTVFVDSLQAAASSFPDGPDLHSHFTFDQNKPKAHISCHCWWGH